MANIDNIENSIQELSNATVSWMDSAKSAIKDVKDGKLDAPATAGTTGQVLTKTADGQAWADAPTELPSATSSDSGKVLTVDSSGSPEWAEAQGGGGDVPDATDYLCFTAAEANSTVRIDKNSGPNINIEYSTDKATWTTYTWSGSTGTTITLASIGNKVWLRGDNLKLSTGQWNYNYFVMSGKINAYGNIMSLVDKSCNSKIISGDYCFYKLFYSCTSLMSAPILPATTLKQNCYDSMFYGCTGLTEAPELPAMTVPPNCYYQMFQNCTSLKVAPYLPTVIIWSSSCYAYMFDGCTALKRVRVAFNDWQGGYVPTSSWLRNVSSTGIFECPSSLDVSTRSDSRVPSGWTIVYTNTNAVPGTAMSVETSSSGTVEISPSGDIAKQITVSSTLTLSASASASNNVAYAEVVIDLATGATVTAGTNLTMVDTLTKNKRNVCVVRWSGGAAKLYVVMVEDIPA